MADKRKIIMDVDTGSDDAIALSMAMLDEHFDLLGVTTVNGNVELKLTTDNTLRVVDACKKGDKVGVYMGAELPLCSTLIPGWHEYYAKIPRRAGATTGNINIHKDHVPLPETTLKPQPMSAPVWLINTLLASEEKITIIAVGPLTNIALAMRSDPRILDKIEEIIIMGGGSLFGNQTPAAEFNIWVDPEASEIVFQSGLKITLVPLDATYQAIISSDDVDAFRAIGTPPAVMIADLLEQRIFGYTTREAGMQGQCPCHDALTLCFAIHPEVITKMIHTTVHTDINRGFAYGETIVDIRNRNDLDDANCYVALGADRYYFRDWMLKVLTDSKNQF